MKITVYVPCHNNQATLGQVLAALRNQTRPADEHLFINDRCTDQSPDIARQHGFEVLDPPGPGGLAAARNHALRSCHGDIIQGIDADVAVNPDYLEWGERLFIDHPEFSAIGGRLDEKYRDTPADLWRAVHLPQHHGPESLANPDMLFGATMAAKVAAVRQLNGWNERFTTCYEDVDLSTRLKSAGHQLLYSAQCRAWHLRRHSFDTVLETAWRWNYFGFEHLFQNLQGWLKERLPCSWQIYHLFRLNDATHPTLCPLTLAFPWSFVMRDLHELRATVGEVGRIGDVAGIAVAELGRCGFDPRFIDSLRRWLEQLAQTLEGRRPPQEPLNADIAQHLRWHASANLPDGNYWQLCRGLSTLDVGQAGEKYAD